MIDGPARVPTLDDVLRAVPGSPCPASAIRRAAALHLRGQTTRAIAAEVGVHHSTVSGWLRALGIARSNAEAQRVRAGAVDWPVVVAAYLAGEPVDALCARHHVHLDRLYRALSRAGVPLRGQAGAAASDRQRLASARRHEARRLADVLGIEPGDRAGKRRIAEALGVSERSVRAYLADAASAQPRAGTLSPPA